MLSQFDNYIFDLDGTLVNSSEEVLLCFKKAFLKSKYNIDEAKLTSDVIGPPLKQIIHLIAPELTDEEKISEIMSNFRQIYDYDEEDISVMYKGIYDFLCLLKSQGKRLFIATFKPQIPTMRLVKLFNLNMFDDIYTIDKFGKNITKDEMITDIVNQYKLNKEKTVMIGDALSDVNAAKKAGVTAAGALWGYGSDKSELIKNSDILIKDTSQLVKGKVNAKNL